MARLSVGSGLAGVLGEQRLGVERVDVRRPAVHEQVDDVLGLGREVRRVRQQRIAAGRGGCLCCAEQVAEGQCAEAHAAALKQLAAGEGQMFEVGMDGAWFDCLVIVG